MIKVRKQILSRVRQGDVIRNVEFLEYIKGNAPFIEISQINFPYIIVLTQDCELEQDFRHRWARPRLATHDKWLLSVLVSPLYNFEHLVAGTHWSELGLKMQEINKKDTRYNLLKQNQSPRYHYIEFPQDVPLVPSVIDFKHYFSVNVIYLKQLKKTNFVCNVSALYREDISQRFASFLSRIGLPEQTRP